MNLATNMFFIQIRYNLISAVNDRWIFQISPFEEVEQPVETDNKNTKQLMRHYEKMVIY